jgi:hypothetical protein
LPNRARGPNRAYQHLTRPRREQDNFRPRGRRADLHYARVFELADACGVLADPESACKRMQRLLSVACGADA